MPNSLSYSRAGDPDAMANRLIERAYHRDGLPEIAVGITFLFFAGLTCAIVMLPQGSIGFTAAVLALSFLMPLLCLGLPWALRWVRRRYLIERAGYVQPKPIARKQIGMGVLLAIVMAVVLFGVVPRFSHPDRWLLAGTGLLGGALAAFSGRLPRFVIGGVLTAAAGMFIAFFSKLSLLVGFAILFGFQGLLALISGGVIFVGFIRQPVETGE